MVNIAREPETLTGNRTLFKGYAVGFQSRKNVYGAFNCSLRGMINLSS
jgi:hypothetical protein